jgi:predicted flavoprotein YhiN
MQNKSFDLNVSETKENLINLLNKSGLPITVMQMILNEILNAVNKQVKDQISQDKKDWDMQQQGKEKPKIANK